MVPRLTVSLEPEEYEALLHLAEEEYRLPKDQLRWLLCREAVSRGLLPGNVGAGQPTHKSGNPLPDEG